MLLQLAEQDIDSTPALERDALGGRLESGTLPSRKLFIGPDNNGSSRARCGTPETFQKLKAVNSRHQEVKHDGGK